MHVTEKRQVASIVGGSRKTFLSVVFSNLIDRLLRILQKLA